LKLNPGKHKIFISGMGHHSAMGSGMSSLSEGILCRRKISLEEISVDTQFGAKIIQTYAAPDVDVPMGVSPNVLRRMSRVSKMFLASAGEAMDESFKNAERIPARLGLVIGSAFSTIQPATAFQRSLYLGGALGASPTLFAGSVQNSIAAQTSMTFDVRGPCATVMTLEQTVINSFRQAYDWIQQDLVDHVLVVIGDELCEYNNYVIAHLKLSEGLDVNSDACTAILGEGTQSFVISREGALVGQKKYCEISDVQIYAEAPPAVERFAVASHGGEFQNSRNLKFLGPHIRPAQHAELYGSLVVGLAFEVAIAALKMESDPKPIACVQVSDHNEAQFLVLS
jgi:3-oxoacyl-(acyl-carrier-protein) synthase